MENDNIDNDKLMKEIESLEDEREEQVVENRKSRLPLIIIIVALFALCSLYFGGSFENNLFDEISEEYNEEKYESYMEQEKQDRKDFEVQKENIKVSESYLNYNNELLATITNESDNLVVDLKVEVIFYDAENKPIEIDDCTVSILDKNSSCHVKFIETPEQFERYEFLVSKDFYWYDNLEFFMEDSIKNGILTYETYKDGDYTILSVTNNYSKEISEACFEVLYYDVNGTVMDVEYVSLFELKKNRTQDEELYISLWDNNTYENIDFEKYEIKFLGAYIY